jgi:hypothetical protein
MSCQHLDVPERPSHGRDLPRRIGDENASTAATRTADEAEVPVPSLEHVHDRLRRGLQRAFGADDVLASEGVHLVSVLDECISLPRSAGSSCRTSPCLPNPAGTSTSQPHPGNHSSSTRSGELCQTTHSQNVRPKRGPRHRMTVSDPEGTTLLGSVSPGGPACETLIAPPGDRARSKACRWQNSPGRSPRRSRPPRLAPS